MLLLDVLEDTPLKAFTVNENHIGSAASEIFLQTDIHPFGSTAVHGKIFLVRNISKKSMNFKGC